MMTSMYMIQNNEGKQSSNNAQGPHGRMQALLGQPCERHIARNRLQGTVSNQPSLGHSRHKEQIREPQTTEAGHMLVTTSARWDARVGQCIKSF
eukprot:jgi/Mesvir1/11589/Mv25529-RA.1